MRALEYFNVPSDRVRILAVACGFFNAGAPQFLEAVLNNPEKLRDLARKSKAAAISTHDAATALGQRRNQRNQRFSGTIILGIHYLRRFLLRKKSLDAFSRSRTHFGISRCTRPVPGGLCG